MTINEAKVSTVTLLCKMVKNQSAGYVQRPVFRNS